MALFLNGNVHEYMKVFIFFHIHSLTPKNPDLDTY